MKKLVTGIRGLDSLFYGGIQLNDQDNSNGLIIAVQGARGCNKTVFAMQLMYGLTKSLKEEKIAAHKADPIFYSLDKDEVALNDIYLDLLIIQHVNEYISSRDEAERTGIVNYLFDLEAGSKNRLDGIIGGTYGIGQLFQKRLLYYNSRTNSVHLNVNDGNNGITEFFKRKYEDVGQYIDFLSQMSIEHKFIKIDFNGFTFNHDKVSGAISAGEVSPIVRFQNTFMNIANLKDLRPCIVLDGLPLLTEKDLRTLPYSELERTLRKKAQISIIVFDDRSDLQMNADIVIELRSKESATEEYLYNELHISKSVFQNVALGWHQYKKRDDGIAVFPSLHLLLSRRNYLPHGLLMWQKSILEDTFDDYENNQLYCPKAKGKYGDYLSCEELRKRKLLWKISDTHNKESTPSNQLATFEAILKGAINHDVDTILGWENHYPSTAIIGNPNSHKRQLAIAGAFYAAQKGEHTIFVLFDKNEADMRRRMFCPAMQIEEVAEDKQTENNHKESEIQCTKDCNTCHRDCKLKKCYDCYKYLHFFQIRMGCISAEEFFDALLQLIDKFTDVSASKPCHIVIDDLQKLDYSFPFLKSTSLFLSTLVSLCREKYTELKMICDKKAGIVDELCSLSDNVLCIKREESDLDKMTIYLERNLGGVESTGLGKFEIDNPSALFECNGSELKMNMSSVKPYRIGSMKEFWRKSYNVIEQERRTISIQEDKQNQ